MADRKIKQTLSKVKHALQEHRALMAQQKKNQNPSPLLTEIYDEVEQRLKDMIVALLVEPDMQNQDLPQKTRPTHSQEYRNGRQNDVS